MSERKLGGQELYSSYRNRLDMISVIIVSATYSAQLTKSWLYGALGDLVKKEPFLCSNVFDADSKAPYHKLLKQVDLDKVVFFQPHVASIQELNDSLVPSVKLPYEDESLPLWRAYVIGSEQKELVWVYDHCIADGSSGVLFQEKLLQSLNKDGLDDNSIVQCEVNDIPRGIEEVMSMKPPLGYYMSHRLEGWKKSIFGDKVWVGKPPVVPRASNTLFFELDRTKSKKLLNYCRERKFTVTSLLYAALMKAIAELWVDFEDGDLVFTIPVNARKYVESKDVTKDLGNFVFQYDCRYHLKDQHAPIDAVASAFDKELKGEMNEKPLPYEMRYNKGKYHYLDVQQYQMNGSKSDQRPETGEISNLGAFKFDDGKHVGIDKLNFTQGVSTCGAYVTMNVVGIRDGTINGSFSVARDSNHEECKAVSAKVFDDILAPIMTD